MVNNSAKKTNFIQGEGLKIPVIDMSLDKHGKYLLAPETLRNSMLELLFEPDELSSLVIVKPSKEDDNLDSLEKVNFGDGIPRRVAFSSGSNVYYADAQLSQKLIEPFKTKPDHACRYGSLLVSSCNEGASLFDSSADKKALRIKIVNFESDDPIEKAEAQRFRTGDCHGKISPRLALLVGGKTNRPFQFRFAWMQKWSSEDTNTINTSFLAKGTFLPDKTLTEDLGYDIILDKSSIKGIAKDKINQLIPCGDYSLPKAILGNRGNAKVQPYENSWQMSIWYSAKALQLDIVPSTLTQAQELAQLQKDPLKLARYLVEQYDKKAALSSQEIEQSFPDKEKSDQERHYESRMISLLRHDKYGQLLDFPKIVDFMRSQLAKRWRELAIKGAVRHDSAMAQPSDTLKLGTIVVPHLQNGEEVIVTRYPIVSKDNIRRYTVDNTQQPELKSYQGCVFIRPDQAMEHHQCDFDGDQLVITPASRLPHIAAETRHANEQGEYEAVIKREKVDYTEAKEESGQLKYTKLRQIAVAIPKNKIGLVATSIGRVQSSVPQPGEQQSSFEQNKRQLLNQLFDALQIEVDSPKSATRLEEYHPQLLTYARQWSQKYPSYFFDFKKDSRLYKTISMPIDGNNAINVIPELAVNPVWELTRLRSRHRDEFRYLFPPPEDTLERNIWEKNYLSWASDLKEKANQRGQEIYQLHHNDADAIKEAYGKLYEDLRAEIADSFPNQKERLLAATALWHLETTSPNLSEPRKECVALSRKLNITFHLEEDYQRLHEALPKDTYILSVPFERYAKDGNGRYVKDKKGQLVGEDLASEYKEAFDRKNIQYEATLHSTLPMVQFALFNPSKKLVESLEERFGNADNYHISEAELTYRNGLGQTKQISERIVAPINYHWLESTEDQTPKSALVLNLFTEEICQKLQQYQFSKAVLIGQKYNDLKDVDFSDPSWQGKKVKLCVGAFHNSEDHRMGFPIVQLDGKNLAMFSNESPKLPIGATFEATINPLTNSSALLLNIDPESVKLPTFGLETVTQQKLPFNLKIGEIYLQKHSEKETSAQGILHQAIASKYDSSGRPKIRLTQEWTAFVNQNTQECFVRDKQRNIIFSSNLKTNKIIVPLSQENSYALTDCIQQLKQLSEPQKRQPTPFQLTTVAPTYHNAKQAIQR